MIEDLLKQQATTNQYHNELRSFLSLTGDTMKALTNYVNADWEAKTPTSAQTTVTESKGSQRRSERQRRRHGNGRRESGMLDKIYVES
jgi:hypothetical protein